MIDWSARKAKEDKVLGALGGFDEFEKWTAYEMLFNQGFRVLDAPRRILELSPKVAVPEAKGTRP